MSAQNRAIKLDSFTLPITLTGRIYTLSILLISSLFISINSAQAAQCFSNVQNAYNHLLKQEKLETQARTQIGVNINQAGEGELTSLNGIGSTKAQAIILYREMFGPFKTIDELEKVKGIGPKTIEKNKARLQVQD